MNDVLCGLLWLKNCVKEEGDIPLRASSTSYCSDGVDFRLDQLIITYQCFVCLVQHSPLSCGYADLEIVVCSLASTTS